MDDPGGSPTFWSSNLLCGVAEGPGDLVIVGPAMLACPRLGRVPVRSSSTPAFRRGGALD
jgi:hypothetical protein